VERLFPPVDFGLRAFHVLHILGWIYFFDDLMVIADVLSTIKGREPTSTMILLRLHIRKKKKERKRLKQPDFWSIFYF
jgi:hypothetical protein